MAHTALYHIAAEADWAEARAAGVHRGGPVDRRDGFIHLSAGHQVAETLARHFGGRDDLVLLAIDPDRLPRAPVWEAARGTEALPHLYDVLPVSAVVAVHPLPRDTAGRHRLPDLRDLTARG